MLSFYAFSEAARVMLSIATVLGAIAAALVLILHSYRFKPSFAYWIDGGIAFLALCQAVVNIALVAQVQHNMTDGFVVPSGYTLQRYAVFVAIAIISAYPLIKRKSSLPVIPIIPVISIIPAAASFLTLPIMETWAGGAFPFVFVAAFLLLFAGGVLLILAIRRELTTSISGLSIKQAMDSLNTAVLFYKENGQILLQNNKMQELMIKTAGRVIYNGRLYFETVLAPNAERGDERDRSAGCKDAWREYTGGDTERWDDRGRNAASGDAERRDEGSYLYRMEDGAWLFTARALKIGGKPVMQLTAADVTELDHGNMLLQEKHAELKEREKQLKDFARTLEEIGRLEEFLRVKTKAHDVENRKLTLLLRHLRHGERLDKEAFSKLSESLQSSILKPDEAPEDPFAELDALADTYEQAGIRIQMAGDLPEDRDLAFALVHILREAAANAVIHGHAEKIFVRLTASDTGCTMRITDNSTRPLRSVNEGGGIAGMRQRLVKFKGELHIEATPKFSLTVTVPAEGAGTSVSEGTGVMMARV